MKKIKQVKQGQAGFTLIEIAIVMVIVGILAGGSVSMIRVLTERKARNVTADYLQEARNALISYAVSHGRLPYADSDGDGMENGPPSSSLNGTLPYLTLQMAPTDAYRRTLHYEVNANLVSDRSFTCSSIRSGLTTRPQVVDGDGSATAFSVAAILVSAGPMDADGNGNVLDDIASGTHLGNNQTGTPNYLRHPPLETTFDDLVLYLGSNELFGQMCEYIDLAVNNNNPSTVRIHNLNTGGTIIGSVGAGGYDNFPILSGTRLEVRDLSGTVVSSKPQTPIALSGRGETITTPPPPP